MESQYKNENLWQSCKKQLREQLSPIEFQQWIEPLEVEISKETEDIFIYTKNRYQLEFIRKKYLDTINEIIRHKEKKHKATLSVKKTNTSTPNITKKIKIQPKPTTPEKKPKKNTSNSRKELNRLYTFENFVEGNSNRVAHSAGLYVANESGNQYNPLYIHGGVGLGKTHLLHAIGNNFLKNSPDKKVICVNTEEFIRDISKAARHKTFPQFQKFYQQADLLLIDDVQFFSSREKSQEEFFSLFNFLLDRSSKIVMSSDTYPKQIEQIPERLRSRFSSGITVEIEPPQLEMRINILHSKAQLQGIQLTDEVAFFIAKNIVTNVRELEGAFNNVIAHANFNGCEIDIQTAKNSLKNHIALQNRQISVEKIQKTTADYYQINLSDIYSRSRKANIVKARHVAMYLSKKLTRKSLQEIGKAFGGRDHTTVLHAEKKIEGRKKEDSILKRELKLLEQTLNI